MSKTEYREVNVVCPFFLDFEDKKSIKCEGFEPRQVIVSRFPSNSLRESYCWRYCSEKYKRCPLAKALMEKYE